MIENDLRNIIPGGRYEILEAVGRGAFGTVYRGRHLATGADVVLKFLYIPYRETLARTDREIAVLKGLPQDNNIVTFSDGFLSPDAQSAVLISEWINGPSLQSLVEDYGHGVPDTFSVAIIWQG